MGAALSVTEPNKLAIAAISHIVHFDSEVLRKLEEALYSRTTTGEDGCEQVTAADFAEAMTEVQIHPSDREILDRLFVLHDRAGDGIIDVKEFVVGTSVLVKGKPRDKLTLSLSLFDRPKAGKLSKADLLQALQWLIKTSQFFGDLPPTKEALVGLVDRVFGKIVDESPEDPTYELYILPILSHPLLEDWISQDQECSRLSTGGEL